MVRQRAEPAAARTVADTLLCCWPLPQPSGDDDKNGRGHVLVLGGPREMPGAAILAATAELVRHPACAGGIEARIGWTFIKVRGPYCGLKYARRGPTNWRQHGQSNCTRIRAPNGAAYCVGSHEGPVPAKWRGRAELAPLSTQRLTWRQRHTIDVNEECTQ